jgi:hypothetical protein
MSSERFRNRFRFPLNGLIYGANLSWRDHDDANSQVLLTIHLQGLLPKLHVTFYESTGQRADTKEKEAVALDEEEAVEVELSPRTLSTDSTKGGLVGCVCFSEPLLLNKTTNSDIVGLKVGDDWVHIKAISMIFFACSASYSLGSKLSSTNSMCLPSSYSFHAC